LLPQTLPSRQNTHNSGQNPLLPIHDCCEFATRYPPPAYVNGTIPAPPVLALVRCIHAAGCPCMPLRAQTPRSIASSRSSASPSCHTRLLPGRRCGRTLSHALDLPHIQQQVVQPQYFVYEP